MKAKKEAIVMPRLKQVLMACNHIAQGTTKDGKPACVICGCTEPATKIPDLTGRTAKCRECNNTTKSDINLPFFKHEHGKMDSYYCGCHGWE